MKRKEDIMIEHCSDNGLLNLHMGKAILAAMQEYADQEVNLYCKGIKGRAKEPHDFFSDEEYKRNSNC